MMSGGWTAPITVLRRREVMLKKASGTGLSETKRGKEGRNVLPRGPRRFAQGRCSLLRWHVAGTSSLQCPEILKGMSLGCNPRHADITT